MAQHLVLQSAAAHHVEPQCLRALSRGPAKVTISGPRHVCFTSSVRLSIRYESNQRQLKCRLTAVDQLEDIDPQTGQPLPPVKAKVARDGVDVDGVRWAYRCSPEDPEKVDQQKRPVLLLHGIGSASYSYREITEMLGKEGYKAVAADWPGHGSSDKPDPSQFDYSQKAYLQSLDGLVKQLDLPQPFDLVVQGFILGQYAMLWAMQHPDQVEKMIVLNTPVGRQCKLRPELAAYKNKMAFLRPDPKKKQFDGTTYNAAGSQYQMQWNVAEGYGLPYQEPGPATVAIAETMNKVDFAALLAEVDSACKKWRKPTLLLFGQHDPFINPKSTFAFLEDKRTNFELAQTATKIGHMPQEDYPEAIKKTISDFLQGIKTKS